MIEKYTNSDLVLINPEVSNKKELFETASKHLAERGYVKNQKRFYQALLAREELSNTEIYPNVAIPHTICTSVDKLFLLIMVSNKAIPYNHPSAEPVKVLFLFGCHDRQNRDYLRLIARSVRLLKNREFIAELLEAKTPEVVLEKIAKYDGDEEDGKNGQKYLMMTTLYQTHKLHDFLTALLDVGINNASIIHCSSMARRISYEIPVFAGLSLKSTKNKTNSLLILSNIYDKNQVSLLNTILKDYKLNFDEPGNGYIKILRTKEIIGNIDEFL